MNDIGKLTTFHQLMKEESAIIIPKVQRDYAYGRREKKAEEILDGMLSSIFEAIKDDREVILDFVYGGAYLKKNGQVAGLIPLDGQQRLTTLFLLYFYASVVESGVGAEDVHWLGKFKYETRQSATEFCTALIGDIRNEIIEQRKTENSDSIRDMIENSPKFRPDYASDPTISSMLNVIEVIEQKSKHYNITELWTKLTNRDNVKFYELTLEKFGLTDNLYIKMNARGKQLTRFEIFKSDVEKAVEEISPNLKEEISKKIDVDWMDFVWDYTNPAFSTSPKQGQTTLCNDEENDLLDSADDAYWFLFQNIFKIEMYRRGIETKVNRNAEIKEIITDEASIKNLIEIFDVIVSIYRDTGIDEQWNSLFYFSDDETGRDDKIRLFWSKQNWMPVFHLAMKRELTVPEMVYFYALYLISKKRMDLESSAQCLRIVRNLMTSNVRANNARYDMVGGFLNDVENIAENETSKLHKFLHTAIEEECYKMCLDGNTYKALLKYENHRTLQGSLMLFIDKYKENGELLDALRHFEEIFNDETESNFEKIRVSFIYKDIEYMQYTSSMNGEQKSRFFMHNYNDLSSFFRKNTTRQNQNAILDILEKIYAQGGLMDAATKHKSFAFSDWQYYYTKYPNANIESTKYGCYVWDDKEGFPLGLIIMNSSIHGPYYLEWKMMNNILDRLLGDDSSLDAHGAGPVVLRNGATIDINSQGWIIQNLDDEAIAKINDCPLCNIVKIEDEENAYLCKPAADLSCDLIEFALKIVGLLFF